MATAREASRVIEAQKIRLDIGCGKNKQRGWIGMDVRRVEGVDLVHDIEDIPWPLDDDSCALIQASHILEHVLPRKFIPVMDEMWRVLEDDGQLWVTAPHGWSHGFVQDPTHTKPINRTTFEYFDPAFMLYNIYEPKPWKIVNREEQINGNLLAILNARKS